MTDLLTKIMAVNWQRQHNYLSVKIWGRWSCVVCPNTLPKSKSSPLKIGLPKRKGLFPNPIFHGRAVSFRECIIQCFSKSLMQLILVRIPPSYRYLKCLENFSVDPWLSGWFFIRMKMAMLYPPQNSHRSHLKIDGWKRIVSLGPGLFSGANC